MKKANKKSLMDTTRELSQKYGVRVTDLSQREVQAIGIIGGVRKQDQAPPKQERSE